MNAHLKSIRADDGTVAVADFGHRGSVLLFNFFEVIIGIIVIVAYVYYVVRVAPLGLTVRGQGFTMTVGVVIVEVLIVRPGHHAGGLRIVLVPLGLCGAGGIFVGRGGLRGGGCDEPHLGA